MIATVRIAPVEQWCEKAKEEVAAHPCFDFNKWQGQEIEIDTLSMQQSSLNRCPGRYWEVTAQSKSKLEELCGGQSREERLGLCEHMLEMD